MKSDYSFPTYRKLINGRSYYKILSPEYMEEIQVSGKRWTRHSLQARILPEKLLISDLLACAGGSFEEIRPHDFEDFLNYCKRELLEY